MAEGRSEHKNKLYEFFYPIMVGIIFIQLFMPSLRLGVITSVVILVIMYKNITRRALLYNSPINHLILLYLFYNTFSFLWFLFNGFPLSVFFAEWSNSILPVFFFYFANPNEKQNNNFYNYTLYALSVSFIVGFVLWITKSSMYSDFMAVTEGEGTEMIYFQSVYGLTATGSLGFIAFLLSSHLLFVTKGKHGKIAMLVAILTTIFTFRRSAMLVLALAFVMFHFVGYFRFNFLKKRYFILEALLCYLFFLILTDVYSDFFNDIFERATMISEAIGERRGNWLDAFKGGNIIWGGGLGAFGHKVLEYSKVVIADGNYFKMIAEVGIIGTFIFIAIVIRSLIAGFKDFRNKYLEIGIVMGLAIQAIGSNILTYQIIVPIFWYAVGRLANKKSIIANEND